MVRIARLRIVVCHAPMEKPVVTSFGAITGRDIAMVAIEDTDGAVGWGDIWGNFPPGTTAYRAALAGRLLPDLLLGRQMEAGSGTLAGLMARTRVLAIQSGEYGPVATALAAADQALWDLAARRRGVTIRRLIDPGAPDVVPVYASGLNPDDGPETVLRVRGEGHRSFKLKVGFGDDTDRANVEAIRRGLGNGERLLVDANQKWDLAAACSAADWLAEAGVGWLEEPMPADAPDAHWRRLRAGMRLPLAGGENITDHAAIDRALGWLDVVQPDVGKWGGVSWSVDIARRALAAGRTYCPHWLAGGLGLMHSANILAGVGGSGMLEMDVNANPLREAVIGGILAVEDGCVRLPDGAGLGVAPDETALADWLVDSLEFT